MSDDLKALNQQRYTQVARQYLDSTTHASGMGLERMLSLAQPQADWRVLDIATGGGHTAYRFAPHVAQVIATDLTFAMLGLVAEAVLERSLRNILCCAADAETLPFADAQFDCVTCRVAAHHFPDIPRSLRAAQRVLKPQGVLIVYDHLAPTHDKVAHYVNAFETLRDPSHGRMLPEYEWRAVMTQAGFDIIHLERTTLEHEVQAWAQRQNCSEHTIEQLNVMLSCAPEKVKAWMQPRYAGTPFAYYTDHHILIHAQKSGNA